MANMAPTTLIKTVVILDRPSDWPEWISIINLRAEDARVEKHVSLDVIEAPTPLIEPTKPLPSAVKAEVTTIYDLRDYGEREMFKMAMDQYKIELLAYKE